MVIVLLFLFLLEICCLLFNWNSIYYYVIFSTAFVYSMAANSLNNQQNKSPNSHCRIQSHCALLAELKRRLKNAPFSLMTMRNGLILASVLSTSTILTYWWQPLRKATSVPVWNTPTPAATGASTGAQLEAWTLCTCCSTWTLPASATPEGGFKCGQIDFFQLVRERNWFKQLWRNQPST